MSAKQRPRVARAVTSVALIGASMLVSSVAGAQALSSLSITPSDARPSASAVEYKLSLANASTGVDNSCVQISFNTAANGTGIFPTGMSVAGVALDAAKSTLLTTPASWSAVAVGNVIEVKFTAGGNSSFTGASGDLVVNGLVNSSSAGTYFANVQTFTNANCTSALDRGQTTVVITDEVVASVEVDPTFIFTVNSQPSSTSCAGSTSTVASTSTSVPFGKVLAGSHGISVQQVQVTSNAPGGYLVYLRSTGVMTAAGGTIADLASSTPVAFGTGPAFGFTAGDPNLTTTFPAGTWAGNLSTVAKPGHQVAKGPSGATSINRNSCVGYRVNITETVKSGTYVTDLVYTAVPTF